MQEVHSNQPVMPAEDFLNLVDSAIEASHAAADWLDRTSTTYTAAVPMPEHVVKALASAEMIAIDMLRRVFRAKEEAERALNTYRERERVRKATGELPL